MKTKLDGGWIIHTIVDEDFHLTIYISNEDKTNVIEINEDIGEEPEIGIRFTTEDIEKEYSKNIRRENG